MNVKVLNSVAVFAESTDLSFRKPAGDVTFKFIFDLADLGISIQHKISPTALTADILDRFSIGALQWFLNTARANHIIANDAPLSSFVRATIITCDARPISPCAPELSLAGHP
jgi:hypothetical protein